MRIVSVTTVVLSMSLLSGTSTPAQTVVPGLCVPLTTPSVTATAPPVPSVPPVVLFQPCEGQQLQRMGDPTQPVELPWCVTPLTITMVTLGQEAAVAGLSLAIPPAERQTWFGWLADRLRTQQR